MEERVEGSILNLAKDTKAPTFKGTSERDEVVIFNYSNKDTGV